MIPPIELLATISAVVGESREWVRLALDIPMWIGIPSATSRLVISIVV